MISGSVNSEREAVIQIFIRDTHAQTLEIQAVVDTGFNQFLPLSHDVIESLALPFAAHTTATLADGRVVSIDVFRASIIWDGEEREIPVLSADGGTLVGMSLIENYELHVEVRVGGVVTINKLP